MEKNMENFAWISIIGHGEKDMKHKHATEVFDFSCYLR